MRIDSFQPIALASRAVLLAAAIALPVVPAAAQDVGEAIAQVAGIPQVNAFLPNKSAVAQSEALPIDGVWTISTIGKRIRIERGRAYAIDSWLHLFTLRVQPDMVVLQNFRRTAAGRYTADDLPLLGPATFQLTPDGNLNASVQGALGPASYVLIKREIDDEDALQNELSGGEQDAEDEPSPPAAPAPAPGEADPLADCENLDVDPETDAVVCKD